MRYDECMKRSHALTGAALALVLLSSSSSTAFAFQAVLLPDQTLKVTQGQVLGKEDDRTSSSDDKASDKPSSESPVTAERKGSSSRSSASPALPAVSAANKKIRLSVEENRGKLELVEKSKVASRSSVSSEKREVEIENEVETHSDGVFEDRFVKLELVNAARSTTPSAATYRKQEDFVKMEDNRVIIQTPPSQEVPTQLEIESRQTRSLIQPGSDVLVDPKTNQINVTDLSGQEQPLQRLPDQAFQDLTTQGVVFPEKYDEAKANLIIRTKEDGSVVYYTEVTDDRKLFGFIPYKVKVAHEVNDATGEVQSSEVQDTSLFGRFRQLLGQ